MWRYLAGGCAFCLLLGSGLFLVHEWQAPSQAGAMSLAAPPIANPSDDGSGDLPVPEADQRSKEARRFDRYDADRNGRVALNEFLASRRKAYMKLDTNGDGRLSFEEYTVKAQAKFAKADQDRSGALDRGEFASTKAVRKQRPTRPCTPQSVGDRDAGKDGDADG